MTKEEADIAGHGRQSFACIVLTDKQRMAVGILYLDALARDAFGANEDLRQQLYTEVVRACERLGMAEAIAEIWGKLRATSPFIHTYE
jgi:hypothetical protein